MNAIPKTEIKPAEEHYQKSDAWIETITGRRFEYAKPTYDIGEIAHALGNICRFTGQCRKFYSVAEHSVLVSRIMEDRRLGDPMEGLLHDGVEAYLADVASPAKAILSDYKKLDHALDKVMRREFKLPETKSPGCIEADWIALFIEAKELLPSKGKDWAGPAGLRELAWQQPYMIQCWTPEDATSRFMDRMTDIRRRTRGLR